MTDPYLLPTADIEWQHGTPFSKDLNDIYWSRETGPAEKSHVFIEPAGFESRWSRLTGDGFFVVAELGFGLGLNFLLTVAAWRRLKPRGILHYVSFENRPVDAREIGRLTALLPDLPVAELAARYPSAVRGHHVRWFDDQIRLTLIFDDAPRALRRFKGQVDAWYLDGFSPGCNPALWDQHAISPLFGLSRPGATLSTYSVAAVVRRSLTRAGLNIERRPGFGRKREMLVAFRPGVWKPARRPTGDVAVIGCGVAGSYLTEALIRRGISTVTIAKDGGTSRQVRQLAVYPSLAARAEARYRFSISAFDYGRLNNVDFHKTGVTIELKPAEIPRWAAISAQLPDDLIHLDGHQLCFPQGGWLDTPDLTDRIRASARHLETKVDGIHRSNDQWLIDTHAGQGPHHADAVFLAMGASPLPIPDCFDLDLIPGLALTVAEPGGQAGPVMTGQQTRFPPLGGTRTISGLYDRGLTQGNNEHISTLLSGISPVPRVISARIGTRAATRDRFPIAGAMPDWRGESGPGATLPTDLEGLFVMAGLGSHGGNHARLLAEYLVSLYTGEPLPVDKAIQDALHPVRFQRRDASRVTKTPGH
ncbi:MAG: tRNA (5-methylaminomethyl-2-thiouridine)(34)-methyltransferase MnmD [Proteobacteria bacterium]|nr:tRNA (5-methylaminomethyl-2-thiouridine)(34)-methyltransferase MnmD [Pseudomonadota bacterium]